MEVEFPSTILPVHPIELARGDNEIRQREMYRAGLDICTEVRNIGGDGKVRLDPGCDGAQQGQEQRDLKTI